MSGGGLDLVCAEILETLGQHAGAATLRWGHPSWFELADERTELDEERDEALFDRDEARAEAESSNKRVEDIKRVLCKTCKDKVVEL